MRLEAIECETALEVRLLAELTAARREISRLKAPPSKPKPKPVKIVQPSPLQPSPLDPAGKAGLRRIQQAVAKKFGFTLKDILGEFRTRELCDARHAAIMLCYALTPHSYPFIGRWFGGRDHTSIMHAVRRYGHISKALIANLDTDDSLDDWVNEAYELVKAGRAKDSVNRGDFEEPTVVNISAERASFAEEMKSKETPCIGTSEIQTLP